MKGVTSLVNKKTILEDTLTNYLEMFTTFVNSEDEQINAIF